MITIFGKHFGWPGEAALRASFEREKAAFQEQLNRANAALLLADDRLHRAVKRASNAEALAEPAHAELQRRIAERAKQYMERPETRPKGFKITLERESILGGGGKTVLSPYAEIEACLEQAAQDLAPDWDHMMARFIDRPPEMMLGIYRGPER